MEELWKWERVLPKKYQSQYLLNLLLNLPLITLLFFPIWFSSSMTFFPHLTTTSNLFFSYKSYIHFIYLHAHTSNSQIPSTATFIPSPFIIYFSILDIHNLLHNSFTTYSLSCHTILSRCSFSRMHAHLSCFQDLH